MTDKGVKKALECCADLFDCISCPCKEFCGDLGKLQQNALDLINSQQAEIERLSNSAEQWEETAKDLLIGKEKDKAEIEKLKKVDEAYPCKVDVGNNCLVYAKSLDDYDRLIGDISAEAIKEFKNKVENDIVTLLGKSNCTDFVNCLDYRYKEMVGK